jgi:glucokinase
VEAVVSGPGLGDVFEFLAGRAGAGGRAILDLGRGDRPRAVAAAAAAGDAVAREAVDLFLGAYGAELRAVALRLLPYGGLYVCGGLAFRLRPFLGTLVEAYADESLHMAAVVRRCPLYLVEDEDLGLVGARVRAQRCLGARALEKVLKTAAPRAASPPESPAGL